MPKTLTQELDLELFELNRNCWHEWELIPESVMAYKERVLELINQNYNIEEHLRFVKIYIGKIEKQASR